jgi:hypothetical protein
VLSDALGLKRELKPLRDNLLNGRTRDWKSSDIDNSLYLAALNSSEILTTALRTEPLGIRDVQGERGE